MLVKPEDCIIDIGQTMDYTQSIIKACKKWNCILIMQIRTVGEVKY